ncbi:MAG TPA: hypothetical protein VGL78_04415 [Solirubrobacteraceae bacterium]|jgi:hypothetical protein
MTYLDEIFGLQGAIAVVEHAQRVRPGPLRFWLRASDMVAGHNLLVDGGRTVI